MMKTIQNVPNDGLISRKQAIDALWAEREMLDALMDECLKYDQFVTRAQTKAERNQVEKDIYIIEQLPTAEPHEMLIQEQKELDWCRKE